MLKMKALAAPGSAAYLLIGLLLRILFLNENICTHSIHPIAGGGGEGFFVFLNKIFTMWEGCQNSLSL